MYIFLSAGQLFDDSQCHESKGFLWVQCSVTYLESQLLSQVFLIESRMTEELHVYTKYPKDILKTILKSSALPQSVLLLSAMSFTSANLLIRTKAMVSPVPHINNPALQEGTMK